MTVQEIKELIQLAKESGVAELEVQRGENRVRIRIGGSMITQDYSFTPGPQSYTPPAADYPVDEMSSVTATQKAADIDSILVKSPIVGTYYDSPSPGAGPFVKVGDYVQPGQVVCIIESMKLMNEIEAEVGGVIVSKLVENGRPVEYGEALFAVKPR
jgi:acetyl-CoA carboxylase biotin carboxyl carrier protein